MLVVGVPMFPVLDRVAIRRLDISPGFALCLGAMKARIRSVLHASPFQPFIIRMADGCEYRIEHSDFVLASSMEVPQVIIEEPNGHTHFLSVLLVTSIEQAPLAAITA